MIRNRGQLTEMERKFVDAYAKTGDTRYATKKAGYKYGVNNSHNILQRPAVQDAIIAYQMARMTSEALPLATSTVIGIMQNEKAPAAARIQAAREVFNRVLPSDKATQDKEPHEMSPDELAAAISRLESAAATKAKPVEEVAQIEEAEVIEGGDIFE